MSQQGQSVVFRRVNGRIVPIKVKPHDERVASAKGLGAGLAIGIAGAEATKIADKVASRNTFKMNHFAYGVMKTAKDRLTRKKPIDIRQLSFDLPNPAKVRKAMSWNNYKVRYAAGQAIKKGRAPLLYGAAFGAGALLGKGAKHAAASVGLSADHQRDAQTIGRVGGTAGTLAYYMARTKRAPFGRAFLGLVTKKVM